MDLISRQAAIEALKRKKDKNAKGDIGGFYNKIIQNDIDALMQIPSAQPEISRIEQELHGKTSEEQYKFLYWLLLKFALAYTDSRLAVIEWLRGGITDGGPY